MKENLIKADELLSRIEVKGDGVLLLAQARNLLKEIYDDLERGNVDG